jgi:nitrite reductase/ring-hydroxylating ferredoxin subunit
MLGRLALKRISRWRFAATPKHSPVQSRAGFTAVGPVHAFRDGVARRFTVDGTPVLVVRRRAGWLALVNRCPHMGLPLIGAEINEQQLTCRLHRYSWDTRTGLPNGECRSRRAGALQMLDARVADGRVYVALPSNRRSEPLRRQAFHGVHRSFG